MLCASGVLVQPVLYLSLYFKENRQTYYDLLTLVRTAGDWEGWLAFFLSGVKETSDRAIGAARRIIALHDADRKKIHGLGRQAASVLGVYQYAQTHPILSIASAAGKLGLTFPTVASSLNACCN